MVLESPVEMESEPAKLRDLKDKSYWAVVFKRWASSSVWFRPNQASHVSNASPSSTAAVVVGGAGASSSSPEGGATTDRSSGDGALNE